MLKELYGSHEQMKDNKSETTDDIKFIKVYNTKHHSKRSKAMHITLFCIGLWFGVWRSNQGRAD